MKNDSIILDDKQREMIWKRVLEKRADSDIDNMADILRLEHEQLSLLQNAGAVPRHYRQLLSSYLADKKSRLRRLQARYYILTGEKSFRTDITSSFNIRLAYENSAALSALYTSSAVSAKPDIAAMYREFANSEARFCGKLLYIIGQSIG